MTLVAGLGNPGLEYKNTRHNIGFMVIDEIINCHKANFISNKFQGDLYKYKNFYLLKPTTFMNRSGISISAVMNFYKIDNLIIIHDDLDLPFGSVRFKGGRGSGGHNGLKSINSFISLEYNKIRVGIGKNENVTSYVLSNFNKHEQEKLPLIISHVVKCIMSLQNQTFEKMSSLMSIKKGFNEDI